MALTIIKIIIISISLEFQTRIDFIHIISPNMFSDGGMGVFLMHKINQRVDIWGLVSIIPLLIIEDRDFDVL